MYHPSHMVVIANRREFEAVVFGADCFIKNFPDFAAGKPHAVYWNVRDGNYYMLTPEGKWVHDTTFFSEDEIVRGGMVLTAVEPEMAWECNECGSQEYTMSVSESDIQHLGCAGCGADEFHKAVARD